MIAWGRITERVLEQPKVKRRNVKQNYVIGIQSIAIHQ